MKKKLLRDVTLESGHKFRAGQMMELSFDVKHTDGRPWAQLLRATADDGTSFITPNFFNNFGLKPPTFKTATKWMNDGVARSVFGKKVEPDGYDSDGSPSWLIVMGLI